MMMLTNLNYIKQSIYYFKLNNDSNNYYIYMNNMLAFRKYKFISTKYKTKPVIYLQGAASTDWVVDEFNSYMYGNWEIGNDNDS